uniref:Uncharacterized protein n=1 Tax=Timema douglasi TaxID=61478 RepID=A0A7R8VCD2_TIMDO|nr:unnamed protein product [Timema douglasi]
MVGNPYRYRAALNQLQNRHATAVDAWAKVSLSKYKILLMMGDHRSIPIGCTEGCLLAALFVIPFIARLYSMAVLAPGVFIYVFLVVPLATGYISANTVIGRLRLICLAFLDTNVFLYYPKKILLCLLWLHRIYTNLDSIHTTTNQFCRFSGSTECLTRAITSCRHLSPSDASPRRQVSLPAPLYILIFTSCPCQDSAVQLIHDCYTIQGIQVQLPQQVSG